MTWDSDIMAQSALEAYRAELDESITQPEQNWERVVSRVAADSYRPPTAWAARRRILRRILTIGAIVLGVLGVVGVVGLVAVGERAEQAKPAFGDSAQTIQRYRRSQRRAVRHRRHSSATPYTDATSSHE